MASRICWHCGKYSHMTMAGEPKPVKPTGIYSEKNTRWFAAFQCDQCGYESLASLTFSFNQIRSAYDTWPTVKGIRSYTQDTAKWVPVIAACHFEEQDNLEWYPAKPLGKEYENVPNDIASAASEAYACFSINANRAAVLLARTAVQAIAKDKGIHTANLYSDIEQMANAHVITDQLKEEAHEIRFLGNDMAHGDLGTAVDPDDAADILGFLDSLLDYVYQQPMAIQKRRELRERRKQRQNQ